MVVTGRRLDDPLAYSKRYDRYDFFGNCLVVTFGGTSPLKLSFGALFFVAVNRIVLPYGCSVFSYFQAKRLSILPF